MSQVALASLEPAANGRNAPDALQPVDSFTATLAWHDTEPALPGRTYWLRHGDRWVTAGLTTIQHRIDTRSQHRVAVSKLGTDEIGSVQMDLHRPLPLVPYAQDRVAGSLIVVDPTTRRTIGALQVQEASTTTWSVAP